MSWRNPGCWEEKDEWELSPASRSPAGSSRNRCETDGGPGSGRGGCEHNQLADQGEKQHSSGRFLQGGALELSGQDRQASAM